MKLIECENVRSVTFSKRKRTLFEKAKRAAASTGATIAIFLISSKEYMHAFGTSCVHPIINEYRARRSNDNVVIAVAQNDGQRLDLLNGDPFDKLKQILECQDVSFLLGPNFDRSNLEHAKKEKHLMSANRVANEQMVVSIPSFANVGAAQFDLNVTAANLGEPERKHKGRQKIEMKLIECENVRSVTFSKRKRTLFEKAKRAAASTGATIAIFLISSKEYMHAFGTSCVHPIINEYRARRSNDNVVIAVAQNDGQRLDLLNGDPFDKLKQILECQDVSFLLGPNFDRSNLEHHVMAAYSWFDDCCTKLKAKKEKHLMSANRVANEQMVVSIPSFANVGAAQFDLNVTAANLGEPERKHKGRQKIEMKLIECENVRSVTFSKRKRTLFEKAKRAAASTGATIAIFLISSKEYMHAFGTSCVHPIINEYRARRSNDNVVIAVAQNDGQRLDLLNGDPFDKLKQILECQDVSLLLGPNFDRSNLEHAKKEKHLMSANRVANEQMVVSIPSFANVGAAQFDLNVTAANLVRGFNLNVAPSVDDFCCISCSTFQSECDTEFFLDMEREPERKHKGRQKIEMKLIECENARSVTFSKRKRTLFEKAKRAAASTNATIAIFLISSKGYMHAFGTSCVHAIINAYRARRSNDNAAIAVAQNDDHRLDLLNGDPVDKLKQILECQDVSVLLGPNFDPSNLDHVMAAYSWFDDCCTKLKAKKEKQMSANRVANEQMVSTNVGAAQFDLNVTTAASPNQVFISANLARGFNLNVAPSADDEEMISAASHVRRFNLNVTTGADDDKEAEEKEEMAHANPTRGFNLNVAPDDVDEEMK
nr:agamous-like MADS-box protein AGL62 [Ipomoea batatas]